MSAQAVGKPRKARRKPLPAPLQRELDQARLDRDRAVTLIRGTFIQREKELDRDRRRDERLAWDRFRTREADIRARAEAPASPDLVAAITKPQVDRDLPIVGTAPIVVGVDESPSNDTTAFVEPGIGEACPERRGWWHRLLLWWRS